MGRTLGAVTTGPPELCTWGGSGCGAGVKSPCDPRSGPPPQAVSVAAKTAASGGASAFREKRIAEVSAPEGGRGGQRRPDPEGGDNRGPAIDDAPMREFRPPVRPSVVRVALAVLIPVVVIVPMVALLALTLGMTQASYTIADGALVVKSGDL